MMMKFAMCALVLLAESAFAETTEDMRLALRNGALGKYTYKVVDDEGNAVSNAQAHVWFRSYGRPPTGKLGAWF